MIYQVVCNMGAFSAPPQEKETTKTHRFYIYLDNQRCDDSMGCCLTPHLKMMVLQCPTFSSHPSLIFSESFVGFLVRTLVHSYHHGSESIVSPYPEIWTTFVLSWWKDILIFRSSSFVLLSMVQNSSTQKKRWRFKQQPLCFKQGTLEYQPKQCTIKEKFPQDYHTFLLFDPQNRCFNDPC